MTHLKKFMREAHQRGIHTNSVFENKGFKVHKSTDQKIYLSSIEVEQIENLNLADTPWREANHDRWLSYYHFLPRQTSNHNQKTFATFHNGIYCCINSTRFLYPKMCLRVIFIRHSPNNDNTPSMPLDEAHLGRVLFFGEWRSTFLKQMGKKKKSA